MSLAEGLRRLADGTFPHRAVRITFDEGYADNLLFGDPILARLGIAATVFAASGYLDGAVIWNNRVTEAVRSAPGTRLDLTDLGFGDYDVAVISERPRVVQPLLSRLKYLPFEERERSSEELAARYCPRGRHHRCCRGLRSETCIPGGVEIGGHTLTHPILARSDAATALREIADNKDDLEGLLGERLAFLAHPNGNAEKDFNSDHARLARRVGYQAALTTHAEVATANAHRYWLPRFTPWDHTRLRFSLRLILNMRNLVPRQPASVLRGGAVASGPGKRITLYIVLLVA